VQSDVTRPVDIQLEAYNAGDIDRFLSVYSDKASITPLPGQPTLIGTDAIRERYRRLFETSPNLNAVVHHRVVIGEWVIDHETVTGASIAGLGEAVVAYEVRDGLIVNVFLVR